MESALFFQSLKKCLADSNRLKHYFLSLGAYALYVKRALYRIGRHASRQVVVHRGRHAAFDILLHTLDCRGGGEHKIHTCVAVDHICIGIAMLVEYQTVGRE